MNRYSITQLNRGSYADRNGRTQTFSEWKEVLVLDASGTGSALRQADQKWPGKQHRANLIRPRIGAVLSTADRADIYAHASIRMKTPHTPGPWTAERMFNPPKAKDRTCGFVVNGPENGEPLPDRICDLRVPAGMRFSEYKTNAALIAAAPDLLNALRELELCTRQFIAGDLVTMPAALLPACRELIAKAGGGK